LEKRLKRVSVLSRRQSTHQNSDEVYFDTLDQVLHDKGVTLQIRRVGSAHSQRWLQTLKTGGRGYSGLSQRGEWQLPVASARLSLAALKTTPWADIDTDGTVFDALVPSFATSFKRTSWSVRRPDGSVIEVALDIGHIMAGEKSTPVCELVLELLTGQPAALFELAHHIACTVAVMPLTKSKAERGFALANGLLHTPLAAMPPKLAADLPLTAAAVRVLREMFCHFTTNLNTLRISDDPEVVHQARVGWRRFKSALRLFKPAFAIDAMPDWQALKPLLSLLGELRDLAVARTDTLPVFADAYTAGDAARAGLWRVMTRSLLNAANLKRKSVLYAMYEPRVGATLLATTQWLEGLAALNESREAGVDVKESLQCWSQRRIVRMHRQLQLARKVAHCPASQHRVRILAKRVRYGIEALRSLLRKKRAKRWYHQATSLQLSLGVERDVLQASALVAKLQVDPRLVEFLRGVGCGRACLPA
jgi:inorganic triphosphatase YgiF